MEPKRPGLKKNSSPLTAAPSTGVTGNTTQPSQNPKQTVTAGEKFCKYHNVRLHDSRASYAAVDFGTDPLCLASQDRLEKVEKEVQSLKGENLALNLVLEEKKTFASVVKDGEVEVDSWKVVAASATKCTLKRHSAVDLNNRFSTLSDECEEGASNTTSATPSVSVERGSSAANMKTLSSVIQSYDAV
ncbi:hypothetical protein Hamer_G005512 [Homarus americanus]|uniref:Uncharacterized protein n=1 Tax=Homarus americanus TaxID=6706 RepID=A0A8J5MVX2_HOMAM|nr:hypothetical protein Hamer_G005512 [Homarus americanus]